jgi:hypothetical protein
VKIMAGLDQRPPDAVWSKQTTSQNLLLVRKRLDLPVAVPKLDVVAINKLGSVFPRGVIVLARR